MEKKKSGQFEVERQGGTKFIGPCRPYQRCSFVLRAMQILDDFSQKSNTPDKCF